MLLEEFERAGWSPHSSVVDDCVQAQPERGVVACVRRFGPGGCGSGPQVAFRPENPLPWFIRAEGYLGAGPAVAWSEPSHSGHNTPLRLGLHAVIHDGAVQTPARALELLHQHPRLSRPGSTDRTS